MGNSDFYIYPYYDLFYRNDTTVIKHDIHAYINIENKFLKYFFRIQHQRKVKKYFIFPPEKFWYPKVLNIADSEDNIIFLFWGVSAIYSKDYRKYLHKHFPNSRIVVTLFDMVKWYLDLTDEMKKVEEFADIITTYDKDDAEKYGYFFHRDAYSVLPENLLRGSYPITDLNFCGKAKDRYGKILDVYDQACKHGVLCDFNIVGIPNDELSKRKTLRTPEFIPYLEYIRMIQGTNCLLEVAQSNTRQYTLRPWEAIAYGKKILTNNKEFLSEEFYNPKFIQVYDSVDNIDWGWVKKREDVDYNYINQLSVDKYLTDIKRFLDES